jgi:hypothetical protein
VSRFDESVNLITDKDVHRCKACGETGTLSPQLWKKRRDCPDDFSNILTFAHLALSGDKGCRVGSEVNTWQLIRGRAPKHLLRKVIRMLQEHSLTFPLRRWRQQCRLPRQDLLAYGPLRRSPLQRRRHHCRLPRQDILAREPLLRSPLLQRRRQCRRSRQFSPSVRASPTGSGASAAVLPGARA